MEGVYFSPLICVLTGVISLSCWILDARVQGSIHHQRQNPSSLRCSYTFQSKLLAVWVGCVICVHSLILGCPNYGAVWRGPLCVLPYRSRSPSTEARNRGFACRTRKQLLPTHFALKALLRPASFGVAPLPECGSRTK
jgi:hypothetical protein